MLIEVERGECAPTAKDWVDLVAGDLIAFDRVVQREHWPGMTDGRRLVRLSRLLNIDAPVEDFLFANDGHRLAGRPAPVSRLGGQLDGAEAVVGVDRVEGEPILIRHADHLEARTDLGRVGVKARLAIDHMPLDVIDDGDHILHGRRHHHRVETKVRIIERRLLRLSLLLLQVMLV